MGGRYYTTKEIAILREHYPLGGVDAVLPLLLGRTRGSIHQQAARMGLSAPKQGPRKSWSTTQFIDDEIRNTYQSAPTRSAVNELAERVGRPRWWVSKRAAALGLVLPRFKGPDWTEEDEELLAANIHKTPDVIARIFRNAGRPRSATSIQVKSKRLSLRPADNGYFTASQTAKLMGVDMKSVQRWILQGLLTAKKRGTERTEVQGGDHWWIRDKDIKAFITHNAALVDIRKVDKFWFIELLTGRAA